MCWCRSVCNLSPHACYYLFFALFRVECHLLYQDRYCYQGVFANCEVKLDLFHWMRRLTDTFKHEEKLKHEKESFVKQVNKALFVGQRISPNVAAIQTIFNDYLQKVRP